MQYGLNGVERTDDGLMARPIDDGELPPPGILVTIFLALGVGQGDKFSITRINGQKFKYSFVKLSSRNPPPALTASGCFPQLFGEEESMPGKVGWQTTFSPVRSVRVKRPISPRRKGGRRGGMAKIMGFSLLCRLVALLFCRR